MTSIGYSVSSNWDSGFIGNMTVPADTGGLHGWTVEFDASFAITNIWNAVIVSHVGNHYVIGNADWNANVAAGSQASFGFQAATGSGNTTASNLVLDNSSTTPPVLPTLSVTDASVIQDSSGTHRPRLHGDAVGGDETPVTVDYATADGTATAGQRLHGDQRHAHLRGRRDVEDGARAGDRRQHGRGQRGLTVTLSCRAAPPSRAAAPPARSSTTTAPPAPTLSITDTSVVEGNPGDGSAAELLQHVRQPDRRQRRTFGADRRRQLVRLRDRRTCRRTACGRAATRT